MEQMSESQTKPIEKRLSPRAKMSKMLRVRPSDPDDEHFEELPVSANVSRRGIYFHTYRTNYRKGMRLFITFPFTFADDPMTAEYLAEVVRVDHLPDNRIGVAVQLIMTV